MAAREQPDRGPAVLAGLLRELGLPETLVSPLLAHARLVERSASRLGLMSDRDLPWIATRHTADSLLFALARGPSAGEHWADVGSGAGFPGVVLACCYPATRFTLLDPLKKRAAFLDLCVTGLELDNVRVRAVTSDEIEERFDVVVARALAEPGRALPRLLQLAAPGGAVLVAAGGTVAAPDGADEIRVDRLGVDSPGRLLMMTRPRTRDMGLTTS